MGYWYLLFGGLFIGTVLMVIWARHKVSQDPNFPLQHEAFDFGAKKQYYEILTKDNEGNNNQN